MENSNHVETELNWDNLPAIAKRALTIVSTEQGFVTYKVNIESGSKLGDGYMSVIVRATIIGTKASDEGEEIKGVKHEFAVLCKTQVLSKARRDYCNSNGAFKREILLYNEYLPALEQLQREYGISDHDGFFNYPTCYYAEYDHEIDEAVIVMKDMRDDGYSLANKYKALDVSICMIVVQGLGRLHALSFAFEKKRPKLFEQFKERCDDLFLKIMIQPQSQPMWDNVFQTAVDSLEGKHSDVKEKILNLQKNLVDEFKFLVDHKSSGRLSVIGHGDSWTNNFLFKFDSNQKPQDIVFIDWQISRYGSPILDLVYFLYTATDKETRDQYYDNLLKAYHDSFSDVLKRFGEDPEKIFPYDVFQEELKKFGRFGLFMSICLLSFVTISPDEMPDMDEAMEDLMRENRDSDKQNTMLQVAHENSKRMEPRIRDIILDLHRFGYF